MKDRSVNITYRNELARMVHFKSGAGFHKSEKDKEKSRKGKFANKLNTYLKSYL